MLKGKEKDISKSDLTKAKVDKLWCFNCDQNLSLETSVLSLTHYCICFIEPQLIDFSKSEPDTVNTKADSVTITINEATTRSTDTCISIPSGSTLMYEIEESKDAHVIYMF